MHCGFLVKPAKNKRLWQYARGVGHGWPEVDAAFGRVDHACASGVVSACVIAARRAEYARRRALRKRPREEPDDHDDGDGDDDEIELVGEQPPRRPPPPPTPPRPPIEFAADEPLAAEPRPPQAATGREWLAAVTSDLRIVVDRIDDARERLAEWYATMQQRRARLVEITDALRKAGLACEPLPDLPIPPEDLAPRPQQ